MKAPVSLLHVRWKLICLRSTVTLREVVRCVKIFATMGQHQTLSLHYVICEKYTVHYCSLLLTTSHCFPMLFFITFHCCALLCTMLFATCESKRQKSKLSKFHYLSQLFNLLCCCRTGMDRERLHQPRRPVNQCTPVQIPNLTQTLAEGYLSGLTRSPKKHCEFCFSWPSTHLFATLGKQMHFGFPFGGVQRVLRTPQRHGTVKHIARVMWGHLEK